MNKENYQKRTNLIKNLSINKGEKCPTKEKIKSHSPRTLQSITTSLAVKIYTIINILITAINSLIINMKVIKFQPKRKFLKDKEKI
jgi:hypothetical protein